MSKVQIRCVFTAFRIPPGLPSWNSCSSDSNIQLNHKLSVIICLDQAGKFNTAKDSIAKVQSTAGIAAKVRFHLHKPKSSGADSVRGRRSTSCGVGRHPDGRKLLPRDGFGSSGRLQTATSRWQLLLDRRRRDAVQGRCVLGEQTILLKYTLNDSRVHRRNFGPKSGGTKIFGHPSDILWSRAFLQQSSTIEDLAEKHNDSIKTEKCGCLQRPGLELQSVVNEFVHTNERRLQLFGQSFDYVISKNSQSLSLTIISHLII